MKDQPKKKQTPEASNEDPKSTENDFSDSQTESKEDLEQEEEIVPDPDGAHRHLDTPAA